MVCRFLIMSFIDIPSTHYTRASHSLQGVENPWNACSSYRKNFEKVALKYKMMDKCRRLTLYPGAKRYYNPYLAVWYI
jgi:hypothetical protein